MVDEAVEHPNHYDNGVMECIDWIRLALTEEEFKGYLKGNVLKYLWRHEHKGAPVQDLGKARKYIEMLAAVHLEDGES